MPKINYARISIGATACLISAPMLLAAGCPTASAVTALTMSTTTSSPAGQGWLDDQESPTHSYTQDEAVAQAKRFSVISALPSTYAKYVSAMKTANPSLRILVYMNGAMANGSEASGFPESWFLHDANGHRITNAWNLYLMNPVNSGWINNRASKCSQLVTSSNYDGCFLDNLGAGTWSAGMVSATPIDPATGVAYTPGAWLSRTTNLSNAVRSQTGKPIFANGLVSGASYFNSTAPSSVLLNGSDIALAETFIRTAQMGITQYRTLTQWKQDVDMLAQAASQNKRVAVLTKVWVDGTQQQINDWHAFAIGSFLLGSNGQQAFEFSNSSTAAISAGDSMLPSLAALGLPVGSYSVINGVYQRVYSGGLVVVNPTTGPLTVSLGKAYNDALTGGSVSGVITLPAHTAQFLIG